MTVKSSKFEHYPISRLSYLYWTLRHPPLLLEILFCTDWLSCCIKWQLHLNTIAWWHNNVKLWIVGLYIIVFKPWAIITSSKGEMYKENNPCPKPEPWGTPHDKRVVCKENLSKTMPWRRSTKWLRNWSESSTTVQWKVILPSYSRHFAIRHCCWKTNSALIGLDLFWRKKKKWIDK